MSYNNPFSLHNVTPTPKQYSGPTKPDLPSLNLSSDLDQLLTQAITIDKFILGKHKGQTFEQVWRHDQVYCVWLLKECTLGVMEQDRANFHAWLQQWMENRKRAQSGNIPQF